MVVNTFRPDSTLKRAEELIAVGQADAALQTLYDFLTSKRTRSIQPSDLEPMALLFVSLAVDLKNSELVKDGLHQYKRNVQSAATGLKSLETVVTRFIELAEAKLNDAQVEADAVEDDDLEETITPETILLSAVSTEDSKDRSERDLITPSLRFLWEAYRTVLDILRNNSKMELSYQRTVLQAFQFCMRFTRKNEFHRLCDILRQHIQSANNYRKQDEYKAVNYIDLTDADTSARFLELRLAQLHYAVKLELWQEAFRSIEDVHTLLSTAKRPPKPQAMVDYYRNLAKVFAVSDNSLFHAAAWQKFFNLYSQAPQVEAAEIKHYASVYLLSTLSIPQASGDDSQNADFVRTKNLELASLLNLPNVPTRASIIEAIVYRGILKIVDPELQTLFQLLETDFHPISFSKQVQSAFKAIEAEEAFAAYIKPLTKIVLTRLFQQLAELYETIRLEFLVQLATFEGKFALSKIEIENLLVETAQNGLISVKIDHAAEVVSFRSDPFEEVFGGASVLQPTPAELVHSFLANFAKTLTEAGEQIYPEIGAQRAALQERSLARANHEFQAERDAVVTRLEILHGRDRALEDTKRQKQEEEEKARLEKLAADRRAEAERKEEEAARRREEKIAREKQAILDQRKKELAEEINNKGIIKIDVDKLDEIDTDKLRLMQIEQLDKDKKDLEDKVRSLARRLGHTERAYRKSELPLLAGEAGKQEEEDLKIYEESKQKIIASARKEHDEALKLKERLVRVVDDFQALKQTIASKRLEEIEQKKKVAAEKLAEAKRARLEQIKAERREVLLEKLKAEREEQEKLAAEEARRQAEEDRIAKMAEERRKRDEAVNKQREIEQAALRRQSELRGTASSPLAPSPAPASPVYTPPARQAPAPRQAPVAASPSPASPSPAPGGKPLTFREKMLLKRQQANQ